MFILALFISFACLCTAEKPDVFIEFNSKDFKDAESFINESITRTWETNSASICKEFEVDCSQLEDLEDDYVLLNLIYKEIHLNLQYPDSVTNIPSGVIIKCTYKEDVSKKPENERLTYIKMLQLAIERKLKEALECSLENGQPKPPTVVSFAPFNNNITEFINDSIVKVWKENAPSISKALGVDFDQIETNGKINVVLATKIYDAMKIKLTYEDGQNVPSGAIISCKFKLAPNWNQEEKFEYMKTLEYVLNKALNEHIRKSFFIGKCRDSDNIIFPPLQNAIGDNYYIALNLGHIAWESHKDELAAEYGVNADDIDNAEIDFTLASEINNMISVNFLYDKTEWYAPKGADITVCYYKKLTTENAKLTYLKTVWYVVRRKFISYLTKSLETGRTELAYSTYLPIKTKEEIFNDIISYIEEAKEVTMQTLFSRIMEEYNVDLKTVSNLPPDFIEANKLARNIELKLIYSKDEKFVPYRFEFIDKYEHDPFMMTEEQRKQLIATSIYTIERLFTAKLAKSILEGRDQETFKVIFPPDRPENLYQHIKELQEITWNSNIHLISLLHDVNAEETDKDNPSIEFLEDLDEDLITELTFDYPENHYPSGIMITVNTKLDVRDLSEDKRKEFVNSLKYLIYSRITNCVLNTIIFGRKSPTINVLLPQWTDEEFKKHAEDVVTIIWESNAELLAKNLEITVEDIENAPPAIDELKDELNQLTNLIFRNDFTSPYQIQIIFDGRYNSELSEELRAVIAKACMEIISDRVKEVIFEE